MSYMYVNNTGSFAESLFQKATISLLSGNERSTKTTAAGTKDSSAVSNTSSNSDSKLNRILNKFRAGHKLTPAELQYLEEKAPEIYQKVVQIQKQREQLEQEIKNADSKEEAQEIVTDKISICMKLCDSGDSFSQDAITNQFHDALAKCQKDIEGQENQDGAAQGKKGTKGESSEDIRETDKTSDNNNEDTDDDSTTALKSNTYASSGDFDEEQKRQYGKRINVAI